MLILRKLIVCAGVSAFLWLGCQGLVSAELQTAKMQDSSKTKLIAFVHGYTGNQETWSKFVKLVRKDDTLRDFEVQVMDYPTSVGPKNRSIRQLGELLGTRLNERFSEYKEVYLIGHSMGGLVICSMVIEQLKAGRAQDLKRIKHVMLFGTPNNGKQIPKLFRLFDKQLDDLSFEEKTVNEIRKEWINKVYHPNIKAGDENYKLHIPVTVVIGLEDDIVDEESARGFFSDPPPVTVPGNHISMKEPDSQDSDSYRIVRNRLLHSEKLNKSSSPLVERQDTPHEHLVMEYAKNKDQTCGKAYEAGKGLLDAEAIGDDDTYVRSLGILNPQLKHWLSACNYWEEKLAKKERRKPEKYQLDLLLNRPSHGQTESSHGNAQPNTSDPVIELAVGEPFGSKTVIGLTNSGVQPVVNVAVNLRCFFLKNANDPQPAMFHIGFPSIDNAHSWWVVERIEPGKSHKKDAKESLANFLTNSSKPVLGQVNKFTEIVLVVDIIYQRQFDRKRYQWSGIARLMKDSKTGEPFLWSLQTSDYYQHILKTVTPPNYRIGPNESQSVDQSSVASQKQTLPLPTPSPPITDPRMLNRATLLTMCGTASLMKRPAEEFVGRWVSQANLLYKKRTEEYRDFENLMEVQGRPLVADIGIDLHSEIIFTLRCLEKMGYLKLEPFVPPRVYGGGKDNMKITFVDSKMPIPF